MAQFGVFKKVEQPVIRTTYQVNTWPTWKIGGQPTSSRQEHVFHIRARAPRALELSRSRSRFIISDWCRLAHAWESQPRGMHWRIRYRPNTQSCECGCAPASTSCHSWLKYNEFYVFCYCPLNEGQLIFLNSQLNSLSYIHSCNMDFYRLVWISALQICAHMFSAS